MMQKNNSLQNRLMMTLMGVTALAWLAVLGLTWYETDHELNELLDAHLAQTASFLVAQTGDGHSAQKDFTTAPTLHKYQPRVAFQIWHENAILVRSEYAPEKPFRNESQTGFTNLEIDGQVWRIFSTQGKAKDVWVHVAELGKFRQDILYASLESAILPLLFVFPLLAFFIWWSIRISLSPLRSLGKEIGIRKASSLVPLPDIHAVAEVQPLVKALNLLFQRVELQMNNERQFTSDAAHELRTPIAAIRMQAQVAIGSSKPEEQKIALNALINACDRATRLISQLLELSRLESLEFNHTNNDLKLIDVVKVTRTQLADSSHEWLQKNQQLSLDAPEHLQLKVNPDWLAIMVRNLVDNASRYSPAEAQIRISWLNSQTPCLLVEDSGPGMSEEDMKRMGDRFFRVLGNDTAGCGLGWSIVKKIATINDVQIQLSKSTDLGGLKVQLTWPAA
jgi:two-component system sensor histidine kinase QseC